MNRLIENTVFSGLTAACRRASWPTRRSPDLVKATTEGVVRPPSAFGMTTGSPASMTATTELVVPRSMPTVFAIVISPSFPRARARGAPGNADTTNIMAAQLAQHEFGVKKVICRIYDPARAGVYAELGLETICPTTIGADKVKRFFEK